MDPLTASMTALGASLMRAVHTRLDRPPLIDDLWGDRLVSDADRDAILRLGLGQLEPAAREQIKALGSREEMLTVLTRGHPNYGTVVIRSRYAEDALAAAVAHGVRQYVIVGAGMDSFGLRRPAFAREVVVFEVDHPATQELKLERLAECGVGAPTGAHFVAADLSLEGLGAALARSSFDPLRSAFFSWLGVTQYLTREANLRTLRAIASCAAPGGELVFSYVDQGDLDRSDSSDVQRFKATGAAVGEPWVSGFHPSELGGQLAAVGLRLFEDLGPEDLRERYCAGRGDALSPSAAIHVARAHPRA
jgi:methyltransferase (TIGR00027 family)